MKKEMFLNNLRDRLSAYSSDETEQSIEYYSEMIDDRIEDGMNEDDVVASLGSVDDIANKIIDELSLSTLVKCKTKDKSIPTWAIVLLVISSPLWLTLLLALFSAFFGIYIGIWGIAVGFWAATFGIFAGSLASLVSIIFFAFKGSVISSLGALGAGILLLGLGILFFLLTFYMSKGIVLLTKNIFLGIKKMFK